MKRKLFTACALMSLLLGVATVWWWTNSGNRIDQITFERQGSQSIRLWGSGGKVLVTRTVFPAAPMASAGFGAGQLAWNSVSSVPVSGKTGDPRLAMSTFSYVTTPLADRGGVESTLVLPAWLLVLGFALLPTVWLAPKLKRKKKPQGNG
jgi:hypothetical protein